MAKKKFPGDVLRRYRKKQSLTQTELAAMTGYDQTSISTLETGRGSCSLDFAEKLVRVLEVTGKDRTHLLSAASSRQSRARVVGGRMASRELPLLVYMEPGKLPRGEDRAWVPVEGSYSPESGVLLTTEENEAGENRVQHLFYTSRIEGCVAVRLLNDVEMFPKDMFLIFGPECSIPAYGLGLFNVRGTPPDLIGSFERKRDKVLINVGGRLAPYPKSAIQSYRPFLGAV